MHIWLSTHRKPQRQAGEISILQSLQIWPSSLTLGQAREWCFIRMYHCTCMVIPIISCYTFYVPVDLFPLMGNMCHAYSVTHGCFCTYICNVFNVQVIVVASLSCYKWVINPYCGCISVKKKKKNLTAMFLIYALIYTQPHIQPLAQHLFTCSTYLLPRQHISCSGGIK